MEMSVSTFKVSVRKKEKENEMRRELIHESFHESLSEATKIFKSYLKEYGLQYSERESVNDPITYRSYTPDKRVLILLDEIVE